MLLSGSSPHRGSRFALASIAALLLTIALTSTARADTNTFCSDGVTTDWNGNGSWSDQSNWNNGLPTDSCTAVIQSGTVTLTTLADHYGNEDSAAAYGLTIQGGATLIVQGESSDVQGNWYNDTNLIIGMDGLTIAQGGTLDLQASDATEATPTGGEAAGGSALLTTDGSDSVGINNAGTINTGTGDPTYGDEFQWNGTLTNSGTINDASGTLTVQGSNYPMVLDNTGTVDVGSGATWNMIAGDGSSLTNAGGTYSNAGTTTLNSSMYWIQSGGSETGNAVQLTGGETLQDSAGTGAFEFDDPCGGGDVTGTIPAGQTVSVVGTTGGCSGNVGNAPTMYLGTTSNQANVVNDGTIVLDADGNGTSSGGDAVLEGTPTLDNHGTIESIVTDSSWANQLLAPLVNESGAVVNLTGGALKQTTGSTTTNDGTVSVGAGATWLLQSGAFDNTGAVDIGIASASSLGQFNLTAGGRFTAGGTLAPTLASGYVPAKGTDFPVLLYNGGSVIGSFASVTGGFTADYATETLSSDANVGVIYGGAAATTTKSTTTKVDRPKVSKVSGGAAEITVKLSCPKGTRSCDTYTFTGTVGKKTVASGRGKVKPGKTVTVDLKLNASGVKLLKKDGKLKVKLVIKSNGKTLKTSTVTVTKAKKAIKKKSTKK